MSINYHICHFTECKLVIAAILFLSNISLKIFSKFCYSYIELTLCQFLKLHDKFTYLRSSLNTATFFREPTLVEFFKSLIFPPKFKDLSHDPMLNYDQICSIFKNCSRELKLCTLNNFFTPISILKSENL